MRIGVLTFPGSNCDRDIFNVLADFLQARVDMLWHRDRITDGYDLLIVPGGFSYGDYLRAGAIARFAPAMESLQEHVRHGRPVIGICNGFQILCEAGFLPGALIRNGNLKHICKDVVLRTIPANRFTDLLDPNRQYVVPVSHSEGNYRASEDTLSEMREHNQIVFRYVDNPNGSVYDIAGITDRNQRVLGMMPHPERASDPVTGGTDGKLILNSFLAVARE